MSCAEKPALRLALLAALLGAGLAGCGGSAGTRPSEASPEPAGASEPAPEPAPAPDAGDPQARFDAALRQMRTGDTGEALQAFRALTQDFPGLSGPYTNLGILYAGKGQREAAIGALLQAVQLNPQNKVALNLLAIQFVESGNPERAEQTWRQALAVDPGYAAAHLNLGMLYEQHLSRPQAAIAEYRAYQRASDGEALAVDVWVAELEARAAQSPADAAAPPAHSVMETTQ